MVKELTVQGFTPHKKQRELVNICLDNTIKYIVACTGRQFGKTFLSVNIMLKWALETNNSLTMFVAPIYAQSKKVFEELTKLLDGTELTTSINKSELEISFINGSKIIFKSAEREQNLRGYTLDYLVIDEAAFTKDNVWKEVLRPTVLVKGKKVLLISTPKGRNWFYEMAMRGLNEDYPQYKTFQATSFDTPYITKEELEEAKNTLPEHIYRQEILAEFIDDGGSVFNNLNQHSTITQYPKLNKDEKYYGGLDFGRQNDYTVLTIINSKGEVVYHYRERQKSWDIIISELTNILKQYNPIVFAETNGIGDVLYDNLKKKYSKIHPFTTTNDSKQNLIEDLIMSFNEGKVKIPTKELNPSLIQELSVFTYEYSTRTRKIKYNAPNGFHDDCVISLALSYHSFKKKLTHAQYVVM